MSIENVKKLELGVNKAAFGEGTSENASDVELRRLIDEGMALEEEAMESGDLDVLERAFDYFLVESCDNGLGNGVCETLDNEIWDNFSEEQIISVFQEKFSSLLEKNMFRACTTSIAIINTGYFDYLRKIFNDSKSANSQQFLDELLGWIGGKYPKEIAILREDMKKW